MSDSLFVRPRLLQRFAGSTRHVTLVEAASGYGASTALRGYVDAVSGAYVCVEDRATLGAFAGALAEAVGRFRPGLQGTLAAAFERALRAPDPPGALAAWFARHVEDHACTVVVDHLERVSGNEVARFLVRAIERTPDSCRWIVASTTFDALPVASWLAHGIAAIPLGERDLALTIEEAREVALHLGRPESAHEISRLHAMTNGCVADFIFLLRSPAELRARHESVIDTIDALYRSLSRAERYVAVRTSLLPALSAAPVREAAGDAAVSILDALRRKAPGFFDDDGSRYQSRFRQYLKSELQRWSEPRRTTTIVRTAAALEADGDVKGALRLLIPIRYRRGLLRLIERYGFASMESSGAILVHEAIEALDEDARGSNSTVLALRAMSASLSGTSDVAESLFQHALGACVTPEQEIRVRQLYANELLRRGRRDALTLLKPDAKFLSAPPDVRVAVMSSLGAAYVLADRFSDAARWTNRALRACARLSDDVLTARVQHTAAWVVLQSGGDAERATQLAKASVELADRVGAYEIASGACSVLYQIAMDLDDDPRNAETYLQRIAVYASKCGNVEKQMFAWVAAYEIEVESGNAEAAFAIERSLTEFDLQYGSHIISEALVSAQVLQSTWSGDFEHAHETLDFSADLQWTPDREALRWAEIAVYAAAAGASDKAAGAVVSSLRKLKTAQRDGVRTLRARLYCALAFVLLGRTSAPRLMLGAVRRDLPGNRRRLGSLATAIESLAAYRAGDGDHRRLLGALEALHRCEFGGVARMLEALPLEVVLSSSIAAVESA